jgi:XTP/dITP diphosphohydrolase
MTRLLIGTGNRDKVREIRPLLAELPIEILTLDDTGPVPEPGEEAPTYWENARRKALAYAAATRLTVVAEDSGLEIEALEGAPGVLSARFLGEHVPYAARFEDLLRRLAERPEGGRRARFVTALAVAREGTILFETEARVEGEIAGRPAGEGGFGYDPIFSYPPLGRTTAELTLAEKCAISHRARAFRDFARWARRHLIPSPAV